MRSFLQPADLFHHRWSVPILAELYRSSGSRFVVMANQLGISPDSLHHTLDALMRHRWIRRNPGYGHPLRPEYILTPTGATLAPGCSRLLKLLQSIEFEEVGLRKWPMPVLLAIQTGRERFSDLKASLRGITSRALTLALKDLQTAGLIERTILDEYPPTTRYKLTGKGRRVGNVLGHLCGTLPPGGGTGARSSWPILLYAPA
ncbi:MAG: winged helix-turn-helix transcriptional regulator [candidate division Zixibacteria bacterium]|nr:winged helix-turn-helix transcriptional regulator [candidate division Zixibacteria bacterium]